MASRNLPAFRLWNTVVRVLVSVVGLLIIRAVVLRLPMIEDVPISFLPLPLGELLALAAVTAIFIIVLLFAGRVAALSAAISPSAAVLGMLANYAIALLIVVLAYRAYQDLALELLGGEDWIYAVCFIILGVIPVLGIALTVHRNLDLLTARIVSGISRPVRSSAAAAACPKCGQTVAGGAAFCASCGASVAAAASQDAASGGELICPACGSSVESGAKFCRMCGAGQPKPPAEGQAGPAPSGDSQESGG